MIYPAGVKAGTLDLQRVLNAHLSARLDCINLKRKRSVKAFTGGYQVPYLTRPQHYYFVVVRTLSQMEVVSR